MLHMSVAPCYSMDITKDAGGYQASGGQEKVTRSGHRRSWLMKLSLVAFR
jgi:hypothetical protein